MEQQNRAGVEFRLLGPVEALRDGTPLALGGPRQQHLLALLLLNPGRARDADQLIDELWAGEPPDGADITLRSYVSRLRRAVGEDVPIHGTPAGYSIHCPPGSVDIARFEGLVGDGEAALRDGAIGVAARMLRDALAEWRGEAFAGLPLAGAVQVEAERLAEMRQRAIEARIEADLQAGAAAELVDELQSLLASYPFRERLWRHLMLALYRSGRQADALAAFQRARTALDEELGLELGEELQQLEQQILRHEVPEVGRSRRRDDIPAQLTRFVGRQDEIADIRRLLDAHRLVTLTGIGGVGKTRLAIQVAQGALPDTPDGVHFVDLSGLAEPALLKRHVARALEVRERAGSTMLFEVVESLRRVQVLLVLDNCEHLRDACATLIDAIVRGAPHVRVLATSRLPLGVPGEMEYPVAPLPLPSPASSPGDLRANAAVSLLLDRARATRGRLADDDALLATAARICRDWTGCLSRSSSPLRGQRPFRWTRSPAGSTTGSGSWFRGGDSLPLVTRPSGRQWIGASSCWPPPTARSLPACRYSLAGSACGPSPRHASRAIRKQRWPRSSGWSTLRWSPRPSGAA